MLRMGIPMLATLLPTLGVVLLVCLGACLIGVGIGWLAGQVIRSAVLPHFMTQPLSPGDSSGIVTLGAHRHSFAAEYRHLPERIVASGTGVRPICLARELGPTDWGGGPADDCLDHCLWCTSARWCRQKRCPQRPGSGSGRARHPHRTHRRATSAILVRAAGADQCARRSAQGPCPGISSVHVPCDPCERHCDHGVLPEFQRCAQHGDPRTVGCPVSQWLTVAKESAAADTSRCGASCTPGGPHPGGPDFPHRNSGGAEGHGSCPAIRS